MGIFEILESVFGCMFANLSYISDCKFPKKSGLGNVSKLVSGLVQVNYDYTTAVKNRIAKEGGNPDNFVGESLRYGVWELPNKVINYNGSRMMRFYGIPNKPMKVTYFVDGRPATDTEVANIKAYLATKDTKSAKQSNAGLNDNQVVVRNVKFENILSLSVNGKTFEATKKVA